MFNIDQFLHEDTLPRSQKWNGFPIFNFIGGHNDEELVPLKDLEKAAKKVILENGKILGKYNYTGPLGYLPLRKFITKKLKKGAKMDCSEEEILIVSGSLQALDLVNETLLRNGDTVIIEEACYGGVFTRLSRLNINIEGIPVEEDGININKLRDKLTSLKNQSIIPRYIYTIPTIQNPTGTVMSLEKRIDLINLSKEFNIPIFEDDCYADLIWAEERPPSIRSLDHSGRVIYCGTFSKSIAPGFRLGYLVADWSILSRILPYKTDAGTGGLEQMVLAEYCETYFFKHLKTLNKQLEIKSKIMCEALDKFFGNSVEYKKPVGGIYIWVSFPKKVDTKILFDKSLEVGVAINPGVEWSIEEENNKKIRLCFANPTKKEIEDGIKSLAEICQKQFGIPLNIANVN